MTIAVTTTFGNQHWELYAKQALQSFVAHWPKEVQLYIQIDDDLLVPDLQKVVRPEDAIAVGWNKDHRDFVERNKSKESPDNYRFQAVRFCHKVFAISRLLGAILKEKQEGREMPRYLVWMDADVITNRKVTMDDIKACLPKEGDAVAYIGRKDWPHSECGWLAFDLHNGGEKVILAWLEQYVTDKVFSHEQWHDSWIFDQVRPKNSTNLTAAAKGMDVWPQSPMGAWSTHYKGPAAKAKMAKNPKQVIAPQGQNVIIQTKNSLPNEVLRAHIAENQRLISQWIRPCRKNNETAVIVSAGPSLIPEELEKEVKRGRRIIAVKHALEPLKKAGIKPWACILLDPRPHVHDFVKAPDKDILWFVASQVDPAVVKTLRDAGCNIWGYHAAVGADESQLTMEQPYSIISGGTATATRGMFVLNHLGFSKFHLYAYDLCIHDKPDMNERDDIGQPKWLEISIDFNDRETHKKRCFWTKPEFVAQFEEINEIIKNNKFEIEAFGDGVVPFIVKYKNLADLRNSRFLAKMGKVLPYQEMLNATGHDRPIGANGGRKPAANGRRTANT